MANNQITRPAGSATAIALPNIKMVLSKIDLTNTFKNCGFRYGGNSNTKEDDIPFKIVFDKILDITNVIIIPRIITPITAIVDTIEAPIPLIVPAINIVAMVIKNGNLPLHGTKLLVNIAINLSLGESIILHPVTPQLLQPNPIHMVIICFPLQHAFLKKPSILNAILGKYPKSSNMVNKGKKIAIGGNITDITHVKVW